MARQVAVLDQGNDRMALLDVPAHRVGRPIAIAALVAIQVHWRQTSLFTNARERVEAGAEVGVEVVDDIIEVVTDLGWTDVEAESGQDHRQRCGTAIHVLEVAAVDLRAEWDAEPDESVAEDASADLGHQVTAF